MAILPRYVFMSIYYFFKSNKTVIKYNIDRKQFSIGYNLDHLWGLSQKWKLITAKILSITFWSGKSIVVLIWYQNA